MNPCCQQTAKEILDELKSIKETAQKYKLNSFKFVDNSINFIRKKYEDKT